MFKEKLEGVKTTHAQELLVGSKEVDVLILQLICAQKRADDAEYDRNGPKTRSQLLQSGPQWYQPAVSRV